MSTVQNADNAQIRKKTSELVKSICMLSDKIPDRELHYIKYRLRSTAFNLPKTIDATLQDNCERIYKIRSYIKAGGELAECKEYLDLIHLFRYCKTTDVIEQINDVNLMLENLCRTPETYMSEVIS
jgi:hypothetical protein